MDWFLNDKRLRHERVNRLRLKVCKSVTFSLRVKYGKFLYNVDIEFQSQKAYFLNDCNGTRTHNHLIRKRTLYELLHFTLFVYELSGCGS